MRHPRLYVKTALIVGQNLNLDKDASHYLAVVLRLQVGTSLTVFNGLGGSYQAEILSLSKKNVTLGILSFDEGNASSPLHTHIGLAMSLGDRMEYAIQKACELGMSEMTPIMSERSELKLKGERQIKKIERWQQVAISSCEQNGLNIVPTIHQPMLLNDWVESVQSVECKLVLHHRQAKKLNSFAKPSSIAALIGPEGGLSAGEIELALQHGFSAVTLGPRVLRTETAPVVLLASAQLLWGDLS